MHKSVLITGLVLSLIMFSGLKLKTDAVPRNTQPGSSIIYIPSGQYLQYAALGFDTLLADLIYIWSIQYFSDEGVDKRFEHLEHVYSIIADLDPHYLDPYQIGAMMAIYDARDYEAAFDILDMGLKNNPDEWIFPWEAGHYAQMNLKDYELAQQYYRKAMQIDGAPKMTERLFANAQFRTGNYEDAWNNWLDIYQNAESERIKTIAANHLYRTKAAMDIQKLEEALQQYREDYGRYPDRLARLIQAGLIDSIPQDMDGRDYRYNPETGKATTQVSPWER
jgi:tetratricopeptide (TPR) repeat protein